MTKNIERSGVEGLNTRNKRKNNENKTSEPGKILQSLSK